MVENLGILSIGFKSHLGLQCLRLNIENRLVGRRIQNISNQPHRTKRNILPMKIITSIQPLSSQAQAKQQAST